MLLSNNRWHLCWQWKKTIRCLLREPNLHYRKTADWDLRISEVCMTWVVCILFTIAMRCCVYLILACNHLHTPVSEEQAQTFAGEWLYQIQFFKQKCTWRWSYDLGVTVHCESWNDHWNTCCNCKSSWMDSSPLLRPLLLGCNRERSYRCSKRLKTGCSFVHRRGCTRVIVRRSDGPCGRVACLAYLLLSAMLLDWQVCF